jgi:pentose-5-phosphate-3-epimerase
MLKCSTSLWSADLANLASEIKRVEPYSERFHLDVADGHYVPSMLFFADLVLGRADHPSRSLRLPGRDRPGDA